jgi:hypothetical protein
MIAISSPSATSRSRPFAVGDLQVEALQGDHLELYLELPSGLVDAYQVLGADHCRFLAAPLDQLLGFRGA